MFCQNCGAELRPDTGFCGVCGAGAPAPRLHRDSKQENKQSQPRSGAAQTPPPATGTRTPQAALEKSQPAYQSPLPRHAARHVAPVASLEVPRPKASPSELLSPTTPSAPPTPPLEGEAVVLPDAPPAPAASVAPAQASTPLPAPVQPVASIVPPVSPLTQQTLMGYYPAGGVVPAAIPNSGAPQSQPESYTLRLVRATTGLTIPRDTPNRIAAGALLALLVSFFLPWIIISGIRASALSVGWPIVLPMLLVVGVGLTIVMPGRALYMRFFLALPVIVGSFFLGCALLLFLLSSAIAANAVGPNFLGVDVGFVLFAAASLALAWAGYYKLLREVPLVTTGRLPLAPLPRFLRVLAEKPAMPTAPTAQPAAVQPPLQGAPAAVAQDGHTTAPGASLPGENRSA
jgi:hypothetical protein